MTSLLLLAIIPYGANPSWESVSGYYSTGGGLADVNGDGITDFLVGEGNDMSQDPNHVYYGNGTDFSVNPSWTSSDNAYSGHIACGDVDGDGDVDMSVSDYIAPGWGPTRSVLYLNTGSGLETSPAWQSDTFHSFACALGDVNGDGRPELAFACGEAYNGDSERVVIYLNNGAGYGSSPWWVSRDAYTAYDVAFGDLDNDGWLDMVVVGNYMPVLVFLNKGGYYDTIPDWESSDDYEAIQCALGDVDGDGFLDLAVAENGQLESRSRVWVFMNQGGTLEDIPSWDSGDSRLYYSTVAFGDPDGDGDVDLAAGGWWEPAVIFENIGGSLATPPAWSWGIGSGLVNEKLSFGEVNGPCLSRTDTVLLSGPGNTVRASVMPFCDLVFLRVNGTTVPTSELFASPEEGFVCFASGYTTAGVDTLILSFTYPRAQDLTITNWEDSRGNFLFLNTTDLAEGASARAGVRVFPNPFVSFATAEGFPGPASLYDASGRFVGRVRPGVFGRELPPGVYFLETGPARIKVVKIR